MKRINILRITLLLLLIPVALPSYSEPTEEQVQYEIYDNISHEYIICSSYFGIVVGGLEQIGQNESAKKYQGYSEMSLELAYKVAMETRTQKVAEEVSLARLNNAGKDMVKAISGDYSNISILSSKYSDSCIEAMTNPEKLVNKWTDKIVLKYIGK